MGNKSNFGQTEISLGRIEKFCYSYIRIALDGCISDEALSHMHKARLTFITLKLVSSGLYAFVRRSWWVHAAIRSVLLYFLGTWLLHSVFGHCIYVDWGRWEMRFALPHASVCASLRGMLLGWLQNRWSWLIYGWAKHEKRLISGPGLVEYVRLLGFGPPGLPSEWLEH